jgi:hypothetical protein
MNIKHVETAMKGLKLMAQFHELRHLENPQHVDKLPFASVMAYCDTFGIVTKGFNKKAKNSY